MNDEQENISKECNGFEKSQREKFTLFPKSVNEKQGACFSS